MDNQEQLAAAQRERDEARQQAHELEAQLNTMRAAQRDDRHARHVAFAEGEVKAGRVLPVDRDGLVSVLDHLAEQEALAPISFSEGGRAQQLTPAAWLQRFVGQATPRVQFGEFAPGTVDDTSAPPADDAELDRRARAYASKHNVSYSEALGKVATFSA